MHRTEHSPFAAETAPCSVPALCCKASHRLERTDLKEDRTAKSEDAGDTSTAGSVARFKGKPGASPFPKADPGKVELKRSVDQKKDHPETTADKGKKHGDRVEDAPSGEGSKADRESEKARTGRLVLVFRLVDPADAATAAKAVPEAAAQPDPPANPPSPDAEKADFE